MKITTDRLSEIIREESERFINRLLAEGGNIFKGQTQSIPRDSIPPTLERYYEEMKRIFPEKADVFDQMEPVGSVGKKEMSGDIDLAIDVTTMFENGEINAAELIKWNVNPEQWEEQFQKIHKRARSATEKMSRWRAFLQLMGAYTDANSEMISISPKHIKSSALFSLFPQFDSSGEQQEYGVQIDWMVGNLKWLTFAYHSDAPGEEQNIKGLHRTQLMLSMFNNKGYAFAHGRGIIDKETKEVVTNSPEDALELLGNLYNSPISREETNNYHSLYSYLKRSATEDEYRGVISTYLRILDSTRADIPLNIQDEWIENQERLNLKGKYLPDDSKLKQYAI